jgi:hypothetical protein
MVPVPGGRSITPLNHTNTTPAHACARSVFVGPGVQRADGLVVIWGNVLLRGSAQAVEHVNNNTITRTDIPEPGSTTPPASQHRSTSGHCYQPSSY